MKSIIKYLPLFVVAGASINLNAQTVTVDPGTLNLGFNNIFNVGGPGYGAAAEGAYQFGSVWGVADLTSAFSGSAVTLGPNQINDPNPYWYSPAGGPGSVGNKIVDANLYNETTGVYVGTTLTFTGQVLSDTLANGPVNQIGDGWTSVAFIKDFAPDFSSFNIVTAPLVPGTFSISLSTVNDPTRHVQYGFETTGPDVWTTDVGQYGTVVIAPVPEPTTLALAGLSGLSLLLFRRRQK
jgi:PEP-CTERM motif